MADEPVVEPEPEVVPAEAVVPEPEPTPEPHPLEPGGSRFNEVYARMKQAEERAARVEGMYQQSLNQARAQQTQPQQPVTYTPQQLQQAVDQGLITPMAATDILSRQNAQAAAFTTTVQAAQVTALNAKLQQASTEVTQYLAKVPALRDQTSADFQKVSEEAYRLSDDMNLPVTDLRVQRAALRTVYGSLEHMSATTHARQQSRDASLPHVESNLGRATPTTGIKADPLKDVPKEYLDYWKRRGYTQAQMVEEAAYVTRTPRKVRA